MSYSVLYAMTPRGMCRGLGFHAAFCFPGSQDEVIDHRSPSSQERTPQTRSSIKSLAAPAGSACHLDCCTCAGPQHTGLFCLFLSLFSPSAIMASMLEVRAGCPSRPQPLAQLTWRLVRLTTDLLNGHRLSNHTLKTVFICDCIAHGLSS